MQIKEFGSDFNFSISASPDNPFIENKGIDFFFSGRVALYSLLEWGVQNKGWKKVLFPSYYCHEVVHFIKPIQIQIEYFEFNPFSGKGEQNVFEEMDVVANVVISVDYFGLKMTTSRRFQYAIVIDDLTHNLGGLKKSTADYCFGSLRKILPVPCGGFLFSPANKPLPKISPNVFAEKVSIQKLTAMYLKTQYLNGKDIDKNVFRDLYMEAEDSFADIRSLSSLPNSALSVLKYLDFDLILSKKKKNLNHILSKLSLIDGVKFNLSQSKGSALGLVIQFSEPRKRDELRSYLILNKVYPAVLWPNQLTEDDINSSNSILFLHIDFRYDDEDIEYLADILNTFFTKHDSNN